MKKTTKLLILPGLFWLSSVGALFAQPVLVNTMTPFPVGTIDTIYSAAAGSVSPGSSGAGITWDFSSLSPANQGTIEIVTPSSTPYFSSFPTTTFCAKINPSGGSSQYVYERLTTTRWEQLANNYAGVGTGTDYTPNPESSIEFPMSYLSSFKDTFQKTTGGANTVDVTYDGYGTLITPFATYTNVVRIKKYWGPGDFDYNWYTTSPSLGIVFSYHGQANSYTLIRAGAATTKASQVAANFSCRLYPNPFSGNATLFINAAQEITPALLVITDLTGRVIKQIPVVSSETKINADGLVPGLYFYRVTSNYGQVANGKFTVRQANP